MLMKIDARVPLVFDDMAAAGPDDGLLIEGDAPAPPGRAVARFASGPRRWHAAGCACCTPRAAAAAALGRLYLARARGEGAFFRPVVAVGDDLASGRGGVG